MASDAPDDGLVKLDLDWHQALVPGGNYMEYTERLVKVIEAYIEGRADVIGMNAIERIKTAITNKFQAKDVDDMSDFLIEILGPIAAGAAKVVGEINRRCRAFLCEVFGVSGNCDSILPGLGRQNRSAKIWRVFYEVDGVLNRFFLEADASSVYRIRGYCFMAGLLCILTDVDSPCLKKMEPKFKVLLEETTIEEITNLTAFAEADKLSKLLRERYLVSRDMIYAAADFAGKCIRSGCAKQSMFGAELLNSLNVCNMKGKMLGVNVRRAVLKSWVKNCPSFRTFLIDGAARNDTVEYLSKMSVLNVIFAEIPIVEGKEDQEVLLHIFDQLKYAQYDEFTSMEKIGRAVIRSMGCDDIFAVIDKIIAEHDKLDQINLEYSAHLLICMSMLVGHKCLSKHEISKKIFGIALCHARSDVNVKPIGPVIDVLLGECIMQGCNFDDLLECDADENNYCLTHVLEVIAYGTESKVKKKICLEKAKYMLRFARGRDVLHRLLDRTFSHFGPEVPEYLYGMEWLDQHLDYDQFKIVLALFMIKAREQNGPMLHVPGHDDYIKLVSTKVDELVTNLERMIEVLLYGMPCVVDGVLDFLSTLLKDECADKLALSLGRSIVKKLSIRLDEGAMDDKNSQQACCVYLRVLCTLMNKSDAFNHIPHKRVRRRDMIVHMKLSEKDHCYVRCRRTRVDLEHQVALTRRNRASSMPELYEGVYGQSNSKNSQTVKELGEVVDLGNLPDRLYASAARDDLSDALERTIWKFLMLSATANHALDEYKGTSFSELLLSREKSERQRRYMLILARERPCEQVMNDVIGLMTEGKLPMSLLCDALRVVNFDKIDLNSNELAMCDFIVTVLLCASGHLAIEYVRKPYTVDVALEILTCLAKAFPEKVMDSLCKENRLELMLGSLDKIHLKQLHRSVFRTLRTASGVKSEKWNDLYECVCKFVDETMDDGRKSVYIMLLGDTFGESGHDDPRVITRAEKLLESWKAPVIVTTAKLFTGLCDAVASILCKHSELCETNVLSIALDRFLTEDRQKVQVELARIVGAACEHNEECHEFFCEKLMEECKREREREGDSDARSIVTRGSVEFPGLDNFSSICYMNVVVQQLAYNKKFTKFFTQHSIKTEIEANPVHLALRELIIEMRNASYRVVSTVEFRRIWMKHSGIDVSSEYGAKMNGNQQEDCVEFFTKLTEGIDNVFSYEMMSCTESLSGTPAYRYVVKEPENMLCLSLCGCTSIHDSLRHMFSKTRRGRSDKIFHKKVSKPPDCLAVQLERFKMGTGYKAEICMKINDRYEFTTTLTIPSYDNETDDPMDAKYVLSGVICHIGHATSGHYISHVKIGTRWIRFDDAMASEITEHEAVDATFGSAAGSESGKSSTAYMLFYQRLEETDSQDESNCFDLSSFEETDSDLVKKIREQNATYVRRLSLRSQWMTECVLSTGNFPVMMTYFLDAFIYAGRLGQTSIFKDRIKSAMKCPDTVRKVLKERANDLMSVGKSFISCIDDIISHAKEVCGPDDSDVDFLADLATEVGKRKEAMEKESEQKRSPAKTTW